MPRRVTVHDDRPGSSAGLRLLAVHAHPDDESSKGAPALARYVAEGAEVVVATCTGGERGDILNPALQGDLELEDDLPRVRKEEMARAIEALGVWHVWLGFVDSGLPEGDPPPLPDGCFALQPLERAAEPLVRLIREFRPHVITTYDENGGYPHPDHIMCHRVSVEAFEAAADPRRYPEAGEPWQPQKLYYNVSFHYDRFAALHHEMERRGLESPYAERLATWGADSDRKVVPVTTRVDCAGYLEVRDRALLAHATQVDPHGHWFAVPLDVQKVAWPTDDYHLARTLVEIDFPENDLFAGVRDRIEATCT